MGTLRWLSKEGDSEMKYDNCFQVLAAKKKFKGLQKEGCLAFSKATADDKLTPIKRFDSKAHEIVMIPKIVGG